MINIRLLNLLADAKKYIIYQVLSRWLIFLLRILISYSVSLLVDSYHENTLTTIQIKSSLIFTIVSIICIYFLEKISVMSTAKASLGAKTILRKEVYSKLLKLGISYSQTISTSNIVQLSVEGIDQLESFFGQYYPQTFYGFLSTMTSFISISIFSLKTGIALLLCIPLIPISIIIVQNIAKRILGKYWTSYTNLGESFLENLQGLTTLKIYQYDEDKEKEMDTQAELFRINTMKVLVMQLNSISIMDMMTYGGGSVGIIFSMNAFYQNNISLGQALFIILLSAEFFLPLRRLGSFFHVSMNGIVACDRIFKFLDLKEEKSKLSQLKRDEPFDIEFKNVNFSYYNKEEKIDALKNINIELKNNEFIALVGESGSGKSTISKIISGVVRDYTGSIIIQNKELNTIDEQSLSKEIVVISNESYIFKGTIKDNLLMAKENATKEEMISILEKVELNEFLEKDGLDTSIEEEGNNLSGGQKQKLALARGLLIDAPFYIFDEATSFIDKESEKDILKVIKSLAGHKSIIFISHRLQNVVDCDRIYLLNKNGEIKECGKHNELIELKGEYYKLFNTQRELENYSSSHKKEKKIITYENPLKKIENQKEIKNKEDKLNKSPEDILEKFSIMCFLFDLAKILMGIMLIAIILGSFGFLCAIFVSIKGAESIFKTGVNITNYFSYKHFLIMVSIGTGILRYGEQFCNHYIAFRLLALIRHKIFRKLRTLCPAKLENKEKGNLISLITSDIELIEVFYAHTISPAVIAFLVSSFMCYYIGSISFKAGIIAFFSYSFIGIGIPLIFSKKVDKISILYRKRTGEMNSYMLMSLRGLNEILQFLNGEKRLNEIVRKSEELSQLKIQFSKIEQVQIALTSVIVLVCSYGIFYLLLMDNNYNLYEIIMPMVCLISSFGPVIALSNLSTGLGQTLACGKRVKNLLEEEPVINEIISGNKIPNENISVNNIDFAYDSNEVLKNMNIEIPKGKIVGILGKSGCGKSTLLKLIMRFWDVNKGEIKFGEKDIKSIDTNELRKYESYLTQHTHLFNETIEQNIKLAKKTATKDKIISAAKKASIHNFIMSLPKNYETKVGELGSRLSSGEKQRIGLARAFLHEPKLLLLDEPTSNLDSLNEGIILKSIMEENGENNKENVDKTVIIVSHRESTLDCVDELIKFV